jgi:hypothetical protein
MMLDQYGNEEDKMNKVNLWNYFEVFNRLNEKATKTLRASKLRVTDINNITMTNIPTIEMDDES